LFSFYFCVSFYIWIQPDTNRQLQAQGGLKISCGIGKLTFLPIKRTRGRKAFPFNVKCRNNRTDFVIQIQ